MNKESITIRKAQLNDLKVIQDFNHTLFLFDADRDPLLNMNWPYEAGEDYFKRMIAGEIGVCFVVEIEG